MERPEFALAAGMTTLRGTANGWGYDFTDADVLDAYAAGMAAASAAGHGQDCGQSGCAEVDCGEPRRRRIRWTRVLFIFLPHGRTYHRADKSVSLY